MENWDLLNLNTTDKLYICISNVYAHFIICGKKKITMCFSYRELNLTVKYVTFNHYYMSSNLIALIKLLL